MCTPCRYETKITGWMLEHHLDNQLTRLILKRKALMDGLVIRCSTSCSSYQLYYHQPFVDPHTATIDVRFLYRTHPADGTRD
ncbi:hypothetical protein AB7360_01475 [Providencia alcalifaciens]|nr:MULTISPECIES: hypothetical protein [Providencia]MDH2320837.1 hypothetical protein [Providencia rettgeri]WOC03704.1 hypothetical protein P3L56_18190 [Providencia sp. PROV024]